MTAASHNALRTGGGLKLLINVIDAPFELGLECSARRLGAVAGYFHGRESLAEVRNWMLCTSNPRHGLASTEVL